MSSTYSLVKQTDELKKLIAAHPDYPICVMAGEEANSGDYYWMFCSDVRFDVGEILDTDYFDNEDAIFTDREYLEEVIEDRLYDEYPNEEDLIKAIKAKMAELEPYWKKVICIYATN